MRIVDECTRSGLLCKRRAPSFSRGFSFAAYALGELRTSPEHQVNGCILHSAFREFRMDVEQAVPTSMSDVFLTRKGGKSVVVVWHKRHEFSY